MKTKFQSDIDDEHYHSENDEAIKSLDNAKDELEPNEMWCPVCGCNMNITDKECSICGYLN